MLRAMRTVGTAALSRYQNILLGGPEDPVFLGADSGA
jgi:hypothetical protein